MPLKKAVMLLPNQQHIFFSQKKNILFKPGILELLNYLSSVLEYYLKGIRFFENL